MKKISFVALGNLLMLCALLSCSGIHRHSINITISESGSYYKINARYNPQHTHEVDECMNQHLRKGGDMSFINSRIKGDLLMDDGTKFYIEKRPGYLEIKFNKQENSATSYQEIKSFSEDLKHAMQ